MADPIKELLQIDVDHPPITIRQMLTSFAGLAAGRGRMKMV
jgi:hypothetical protein